MRPSFYSAYSRREEARICDRSRSVIAAPVYSYIKTRIAIASEVVVSFGSISYVDISRSYNC